MIYFPILEPEQNEEYSPDYPFLETRFRKGYRETRSLGYKIRSWKTEYLLFDKWYTVNLRPYAATTAYAIGDYVRVGSYVYLCVVAGTSGGSPPSWGTTAEGLTTDSGITWSCYKDNQLQAVIDFVDNRKGRVEPFYVWMPIIQAWIMANLQTDPIRFIPYRSGLYKGVRAEIGFEEFWNAA